MIKRILKRIALVALLGVGIAFSLGLAAPPPATTAPPSDPAAPPPTPAAPPYAPASGASTSRPDTAKPAPSTDPAARSEAVIDQLARGDYDGIYALFNGDMKAALPKEQLKSIWEQIQGKAGPFKSHGKAELLDQGGFKVGRVLMTFEKAELMTTVAWNDKGEMAGLFFKPVAPEPSYTSPPYVEPSTVTEREAVAGTTDWPLPATLAIPAGEGPFPAVVLVHGSGPNDRDETVGGVKVFRDLAGGLATRGIAVLRYEKRTKQFGERIASSKAALTLNEEVIDDALAAVALLRKTPKIDTARIFVIGHSLGGMLVPELARRDPSIAGIVSMAGPTRSFEEMMREQTAYILSQAGVPEDVRKAKLAELDADLEKVRRVRPGVAAAGGDPILGAPPSYWASLHAYHPLETAKSIKTPFLILQGERDYQVTMKDYAAWKAALAGRPEVEARSYPKLNHLFVTGEVPSVPAEYEQPGHVAVAVVDDLAAWIKRQPPVKPAGRTEAS